MTSEKVSARDVKGDEEMVPQIAGVLDFASYRKGMKATYEK